MSSIEPELKGILSNSVFQTNDQSFRQKFNQESFQFSHQLSGNSLFKIPRLVELANLEDVNLFSQSDRLILTEQEIERYFVGDFQAATYREENQSKASVYHLTPGIGVHHPEKAPHWLKNGDRTSVALSINFCMRASDLQARVYQVNYYLRKLGFQPTPPGKSPFKDKLKIAIIGIFSKRKPDLKDDVVFSGIARINAVYKSFQRFLNKLRS